jgi:ubiquinol-cytochrome c reductase cytochrome b subunit
MVPPGAPQAPPQQIEREPSRDRLIRYLAERTAFGRRASSFAEVLRGRVVPTHWSNLFGIVTMACLAVLFVTGLFLMFFYSPSSTIVEYRGGYSPLQGIELSRALDSTLHISFEVRAGLLMRQAHHWAGLLLPASLILQLLTTFFTGAFRRPRRGSWVLLFLVFIVALVGGWSGYALPDDLLSGTGLRIVEGIVLAIPVVGTWASSLLFGGEYPGEIIEHLYPIHVAVVPVLLVLLLAARIWVAYEQRPPQFPGPGRSERTIVGAAILPDAATRAGGLLAVVIGILFLVSATVTVSPVWLYGPSAPGDASAGSQPDWYTGFLDGALRLVPPGWEFVWLGHTWTLAVLVPLAVVTLFLGFVVAYPYLEGWITGDHADHHLLDRPRNTPTRTAIGVAGITFYGILWGAASADLISAEFHLSLETVIPFLQLAVLVGPTIVFILTRRICLALQRKDRELLLHGVETGRIVRMPGGEYLEIHAPLGDFERWRLLDVTEYAPLVLRPDANGRISWTQRLRHRLSRFFFEDRMSPASTCVRASQRSPN